MSVQLPMLAVQANIQQQQILALERLTARPASNSVTALASMHRT